MNFTAQDLIQFFLVSKGRMKRLNFLLAVGLTCLLSFCVTKLTQQGNDMFTVLIAFPLACLIAYAYFILSIKRLHDMNHSGWLCLIHFIPLVNFFFFFYLLLKAPVDVGNRY